MNNKNLIQLLKLILKGLKNNGVSINNNLQGPEVGYMVSLQDKETKVLQWSALPLDYKIQHIIDYIEKHNISNTLFYGLWLDKTTDIMYFDISDNILYKDHAYRLGKERNQISIYSVSFQKVIYIN